MSEALGDFLARQRDAWVVLADGEALTVAPSARRVREDLLRAVGADPALPEPVAPSDAEPVLDALADRLPSGAPRHRGPRPERAGDDGHGRRLALRPRRRRPGGGPGRRPGRGRSVSSRTAGSRSSGWASAVPASCNYVSDVDVIFVAEAADGRDESQALGVATSLAKGLMRACIAVTPEGSIWEVDAALRPEGKHGALVRTIASHVGYYERWAKTWEFQALLKARPVAGDVALGAAYVDAVSPFVWSAADHPGFVDDVQAMRRRVEQHVPARIADRELKLGPGGLRDVEFSVQLLQLVHGRSDVMLRSPTTMTALEALATWGYVGRDDAATLGRRLPLPAHAGAPPPAVPPAAHAHDARGRGGPAPDRAVARLPAGPRRRVDGRVASPWPRGPAPAREAVLPTPAQGGGPAGRRGGAAEPAGRRAAAGGARLPRPAERPAPSAGPHLGREPARGDPADAAAGHARLVRRCARPRLRPAGLPSGQRGARFDALVPAAAAGRVGRRRAAGPRARDEPVRHRPAAASPRVRRDAGRTRPSCDRAASPRCCPR